MTRRTRMTVCAAALAVLGVVLGIALADLPPVGELRTAVGETIAARFVSLRHATAAVGGITFDVRGFDTLVEELMLFTAAAGVTHLLRLRRDEPERERGPEPQDVSPLTGLMARVLVAPTVLFGLYVIAHGHLTPGGGFQGGAILIAAPLVAFLGGALTVFRRADRETALDAADALGAAGFAVLGLLGLVIGGTLMTNFIAFGTTSSLLSGGTIALANLAVGLEVAAALTLVVSEFAEQALLGRGGDR